MNPQDRQLFETLTQRQERLEEALAQLRLDLKELERRAEKTAPSVEAMVAPKAVPIPVEVSRFVEPPPLSAAPVADEPVTSGPPVFVQTAPQVPEVPVLPPLPQVVAERSVEVAPPLSAEEKQRAREVQFGRWLVRIGAVFAVLTLIYFSLWTYKTYHNLMGPWSKLGFLTTVSIALVAAGLRLEKKDPKLTVYGRTLAGGGLACLYYTLYGATYVAPLQVIDSPLFGGLILLGWSAYVLYLAEKKKSELLSMFAIALAYFSSAITPVGEFTMAANLILAVTAVVFLIRNAWTGLSYLCLVGTYVGLLRQFVDYDGTSFLVYNLRHDISFWPAAIYLAGAWVIYTAGIFLATTPQFDGGKRMAFLCLNNGALIGLLLLSSSLSGFDHIGAILCVVGGVLLGTSWLAAQLRAEEGDVVDAYLMQGLGVGTGGLVMVYSGATRGLIITVESVFLAAAGAYSRNLVMRCAALVSALLGTGFLLEELGSNAVHPWVLIVGGAAAMLANAWFVRRDLWHQLREVAAQSFVWSSAYYIFLALLLLGFGINHQDSTDTAAPVMAGVAVGLTFSVYLVPLFELTPLAQLLLLFGLGLVTLPPDHPHPWWSEALVGLGLMTLATWWPRQKIIRTEVWLQVALVAYALGAVGLCFTAIHPHVATQTWMIAASLLSLGFLLYGMAMSSGAFAVAGQLLLACGIYTFLALPGVDFPWTWWAAVTPIVVTYLTAWLLRAWLQRSEAARLEAGNRELLKLAVPLYQTLTLLLVVRWVFGIVPDDHVPLTFYALGTGLVVWNLIQPSSLGVRFGLVLDLFGSYAYVSQAMSEVHYGTTWANALGLVLLLGQPALLRYGGRDIVSRLESWLLILLSSGLAWLYVSTSISDAQSFDQTLGWALVALALILIGFAANERRQRWCGLGVLVAAILRVAVYDFWKFSDFDKVITFFALTVICLGLSFLYYKFADRLKDWL